MGQSDNMGPGPLPSNDALNAGRVVSAKLQAYFVHLEVNSMVEALERHNRFIEPALKEARDAYNTALFMSGEQLNAFERDALYTYHDILKEATKKLPK